MSPTIQSERTMDESSMMDSLERETRYCGKCGVYGRWGRTHDHWKYDGGGNGGAGARAHAIGTFQGNETPIVKSDMVRTKSLGILRSSRRLIVALSRGRFALYCIYNESGMTTNICDEFS
ncbi:hypothetical protein N7475_007383 [Penicillium sp. IBT 31633x]|nr:hypothetical protein N7475_007383 [Penicillium sp. IBT 31633x]